MKKYIFIHGACQGGWVWHKIEGLLKSNSIDYDVPDLPGHGEDKTPLSEITLDKYVESIRSIINKTDKKIIFVAHSMGGFIASQVADLEYKRIDKIIYIASLIPKNNETISGILQMDKTSKLMYGSIFSKDKKYVELDLSKSDEILYNNCSVEDIEFGKRKLCKQSLLPFITSIKLSEHFDSIPKYYIKTLNDNSLSIEFQNEICSRYDNVITKEIKSGHAPFFSNYLELFDVIININ